jgi:hypothetical protein
MYFTSSMRNPKETADESACVRFARDFLPEVNKALAEVYGDTPKGDADAKPATTTAAEPKTEAAKPASTATSETATSEKKTGELTSEKELFGSDATKTEPKAKP